jgi:hypothetical protein
MRLKRLRAFHPCRLSLARQVTRRMATGQWLVRRPLWTVDPDGRAQAVYVIDTGLRRYALLCLGRGDEAGFALCDGVPEPADIARIGATIARRDLGRVSARELCLARAYHEAGLWDHVVGRLAAGRQPDPERIGAAGILMQVGPVHASGAFGTADRDLIAERAEMQAPFEAEVLTLSLIRLFARDLVEAKARTRGNARAIRLTPAVARALGIGITAGLELAGFAIAHPFVFNAWIMAREEAIARVTALRTLRPADWTAVRDMLDRLAATRASLAADLSRLSGAMAAGPEGARPWARLMVWAEDTLGLEAQEVLASTMLEPYGGLIDGLGHCMSDTLDRDFRIDGSLSVERTRAMIAAVHGWALSRDWTQRGAACLAPWLVDARHDPRLGPGPAAWVDPLELPVAAGRDAARAWTTLAGYPDETPIANVLLEHPDHRRALRRAQIAAFAPYAEVRDSLIGADASPCDLLRAMLSFLGATDVDASSDRRMQARLFAGAPYPTDPRPATDDPWMSSGAVT